MPIIDFHNHYYPPEYIKAIEQGPSAVRITYDNEGNPRLHYPGDYNIAVRGHRDIDYRIEVTKKEIAPVAHLLTLLGGVAHAAAPDTLVLDTHTVGVWAGRMYDIQYSTADVLVKAQSGPQSKELDKKTFDNEGNYHFDISAGIPINGVKELQYDPNAGTATPKAAATTNAYGLVNYFFRPVDVKTNYTVWPPSLLGGVGLTGHPGDKPFAGVGLGYGKLSGFVGCVFNKVKNSGTASGTTSGHREGKLVFGINITAKQVADLLGKNK